MYTKKPDLVCLMETKVNHVHLERLRMKLGYKGLFYVDSVGIGGGLALFWKVNNMARNDIDLEISILDIQP